MCNEHTLCVLIFNFITTAYAGRNLDTEMVYFPCNSLEKLEICIDEAEAEAVKMSELMRKMAKCPYTYVRDTLQFSRKSRNTDLYVHYIAQTAHGPS